MSSSMSSGPNPTEDPLRNARGAPNGRPNPAGRSNPVPPAAPYTRDDASDLISRLSAPSSAPGMSTGNPTDVRPAPVATGRPTAPTNVSVFDVGGRSPRQDSSDSITAGFNGRRVRTGTGPRYGGVGPTAHQMALENFTPRGGWSGSIAHYASLLIAENPTAAHRNYLRTGSARFSSGYHGDGASEPGSRSHSNMLRQHSGLGPKSEYDRNFFRENGLSSTPTAVDTARAYPELVPAREPSTPGTARTDFIHPVLQEQSMALATGADPDDARVANPEDYWYRILKWQQLRNRKRRGRRHYLATVARLKRTYIREPSAQWPTGHTTRHALESDGPPRWWDWPYVYLMTTFDFLSPSYVIGNLAVLLLVLMSIVTVTYMYMAGGYANWLSTDAAAPVLQSSDPDVSRPAMYEIGQGGNTTEVRLWGPRVLSRRISNNTHFPDEYLVDWGALAPAVVAGGGESKRYFVSLFVHRSWWHFFILAACTVIAGAIMERRYGLLRTTVMAVIIGTSGTLLAASSVGKCSVVVGLAPLAWGFMAWWIVDVSAIMSFWMWNDFRKIKLQLSKWRNLSKLLLMACSLLLLITTEGALKQSTFASALGGLLSGLMIAPVLVPRWTTSQHEALSVVLATVGVLLFCVVVPIAAVSRVSGLSSDANPCGFTPA